MPDHSTIIDFHQHFVPGFYRDVAVTAGYGSPDGMAAFPDWSVEEALGMMDRNGIAVGVASVSSPGVHFGDDAAARSLARAVNEHNAGVRDKHPNRFAFLASLPLPDIGGALAEIDHAYDALRADGVVLETNARGMYLGDPAMGRVLNALDGRHALVVLHPTSPPNWEAVALGWGRPMIEFPFDTTRAVADLLLRGEIARRPGIRMVVPHGGGALASLADRIDGFAGAFLSDADRLDVTGQLANLYYDLAGAPVPRLLPSLLELTDPSHLLYGTDWPWTSETALAATTAEIRATRLLDQDQIGALMTANGLPRCLTDSPPHADTIRAADLGDLGRDRTAPGPTQMPPPWPALNHLAGRPVTVLTIRKPRLPDLHRGVQQVALTKAGFHSRSDGHSFYPSSACWSSSRSTVRRCSRNCVAATRISACAMPRPTPC